MALKPGSIGVAVTPTNQRQLLDPNTNPVGYYNDQGEQLQKAGLGLAAELNYNQAIKLGAAGYQTPSVSPSLQNIPLAPLIGQVAQSVPLQQMQPTGPFNIEATGGGGGTSTSSATGGNSSANANVSIGGDQASFIPPNYNATTPNFTQPGFADIPGLSPAAMVQPGANPFQLEQPLAQASGQQGAPLPQQQAQSPAGWSVQGGGPSMAGPQQNQTQGSNGTGISPAALNSLIQALQGGGMPQSPIAMAQADPTSVIAADPTNPDALHALATQNERRRQDELAKKKRFFVPPQVHGIKEKVFDPPKPSDADMQGRVRRVIDQAVPGQAKRMSKAPHGIEEKVFVPPPPSDEQMRRGLPQVVQFSPGAPNPRLTEPPPAEAGTTNFWNPPFPVGGQSWGRGSAPPVYEDLVPKKFGIRPRDMFSPIFGPAANLLPEQLDVNLGEQQSTSSQAAPPAQSERVQRAQARRDELKRQYDLASDEVEAALKNPKFTERPEYKHPEYSSGPERPELNSAPERPTMRQMPTAPGPVGIDDIYAQNPTLTRSSKFDDDNAIADAHNQARIEMQSEIDRQKPQMDAMKGRADATAKRMADIRAHIDAMESPTEQDLDAAGRAYMQSTKWTQIANALSGSPVVANRQRYLMGRQQYANERMAQAKQVEERYKDELKSLGDQYKEDVATLNKQTDYLNDRLRDISKSHETFANREIQYNSGGDTYNTRLQRNVNSAAGNITRQQLGIFNTEAGFAKGQNEIDAREYLGELNANTQGNRQQVEMYRTDQIANTAQNRESGISSRDENRNGLGYAGIQSREQGAYRKDLLTGAALTRKGALDFNKSEQNEEKISQGYNRLDQGKQRIALQSAGLDLRRQGEERRQEFQEFTQQFRTRKEWVDGLGKLLNRWQGDRRLTLEERFKSEAMNRNISQDEYRKMSDELNRADREEQEEYRRTRAGVADGFSIFDRYMKLQQMAHRGQLPQGLQDLARILLP